MKFRLLICISAILLSLPPSSVIAQNTRLYSVEVSTPILERDFAFARKNAFQLAQNRIFALAVEELVDTTFWETFQNQILKKQSEIPTEYVASVRIQNEYNDQTTFHMILEESIRVDLLAKSLRSLGFILKEDPYYPVTFLIDHTIDFPEDAIIERLRLFHLNVTELDFVYLTGFTAEERNSREFIEDLFASYPQNGVIFLTEAIYDEFYFSISEIRTRIFRKADMEVLNTFSLNLKHGSDFLILDSANINNAFLLERYLALFSQQSIKKSEYNQGLQSVFRITVTGLDSPYLRNQFEKQMIEKNSSISSYSLISLSSTTGRYSLQSDSSPQAFIDEIFKPNPFFEVFIQNQFFNEYDLLVYSKLTKTVEEMNLWTPDKSILSKIYASTNELEDLLSDDFAYLYLDIDLIPIAEEKEPNDSDISTNNLPYDQFVLGRISSRGDEDIFHIGSADMTTDAITHYFESVEPQPEAVLDDATADVSRGEYLMERLFSEQGGAFVGDEDQIADITSDHAQIEDFTTDSLFEEESDLFIGSSVDNSDDDTDPMTIDQYNFTDILLKEKIARAENQTGEEVSEHDITFEFEVDQKDYETVLTVEWIRIGKTTLSPQIRLYDEKFNFINAYTLIGDQNRLKITHTFKEKPPKSIYIRVLDRIGLIGEGETGGFKFFHYILKYNWQKRPVGIRTVVDTS